MAAATDGIPTPVSPAANTPATLVSPVGPISIASAATGVGGANLHAELGGEVAALMEHGGQRKRRRRVRCRRRTGSSRARRPGRRPRRRRLSTATPAAIRRSWSSSVRPAGPFVSSVTSELHAVEQQGAVYAGRRIGVEHAEPVPHSQPWQNGQGTRSRPIARRDRAGRRADSACRSPGSSAESVRPEPSANVTVKPLSYRRRRHRVRRAPRRRGRRRARAARRRTARRAVGRRAREIHRCRRDGCSARRRRRAGFACGSPEDQGGGQSGGLPPTMMHSR